MIKGNVIVYSTNRRLGTASFFPSPRRNRTLTAAPQSPISNASAMATARRIPGPRQKPATHCQPTGVSEVVFDYGEHDLECASGRTRQAWPAGTIRFRPIVRVRGAHLRLCQRVLMFHHFPTKQKSARNCLVRSTDFTFLRRTNSGAKSHCFPTLLSVKPIGLQNANRRLISSYRSRH